MCVCVDNNLKKIIRGELFIEPFFIHQITVYEMMPFIPELTRHVRVPKLRYFQQVLQQPGESVDATVVSKSMYLLTFCIHVKLP